MGGDVRLWQLVLVLALLTQGRCVLIQRAWVCSTLSSDIYSFVMCLLLPLLPQRCSPVSDAPQTWQRTALQPAPAPRYKVHFPMEPRLLQISVFHRSEGLFSTWHRVCRQQEADSRRSNSKQRPTCTAPSISPLWSCIHCSSAAVGHG